MSILFGVQRMKLSDLNIHDIGNTIQMVGAIFSGKGNQFLCILPDESGQEFDNIEILEMSPEEWNKFLHQTDHLEVEMTQAEETTGKIMKAIVRKSQRQIDQSISWNVYRRDGFKCRYCGSEKVPMTVDHIICWEDGGPSTENNLVTACRKCNRSRGNLPYADWLVSPYCLKISRNLTSVERYNNTAIIGRLDKIERVKYKRQR